MIYFASSENIHRDAWNFKNTFSLIENMNFLIVRINAGSSMYNQNCLSDHVLDRSSYLIYSFREGISSLTRPIRPLSWNPITTNIGHQPREWSFSYSNSFRKCSIDLICCLWNFSWLYTINFWMGFTSNCACKLIWA